MNVQKCTQQLRVISVADFNFPPVCLPVHWLTSISQRLASDSQICALINLIFMVVSPAHAFSISSLVNFINNIY